MTRYARQPRPARRAGPAARARLAPAAALAVASVLAVAGCGGGDGTPTRTVGSSASIASPTGTKNQVDLAFASTMVPHAVQSLAATQIAGQRATRPKVKELSTAIAAAAQPQVETLSAWLISWGQPVPQVPTSTNGGAAISTEDLKNLGSASAADFDKMWLEIMLRHQQIALVLAQRETKSGANPGLKAMAQKMLDERQPQVTAIEDLLGLKRLPSPSASPGASGAASATASPTSSPGKK